MSELLPCPFCGDESPERSYTTKHDYPHYYVECRQCGAKSGASMDRDYHDKWNTRAAPQAPAQPQPEQPGTKTLRDEFAMSVMRCMNSMAWDSKYAKQIAREIWAVTDAIMEMRSNWDKTDDKSS